MNRFRWRCVLPALLIGLIFQTSSDAMDLNAHLGIIPPHAETGVDGQPRGGFVELVRALDEVYTEGRIIINLYPVARASHNLRKGKADFVLPTIPHPHIPLEDQPYAFAQEPIVEVSFVLYTRADRPVLSMDKIGNYRIDVVRGTDIFSFAVHGIGDFQQGILRVIAGRSDGFISEQEGADAFIRKNKVKNIHRTLYATFNASIMIPKGPRGKEIDRIVSQALRTLKESGKLRKITDTIHRSYSDWQPHRTDW